MPHLSETYARTGILSRNATYRDDCRSRMPSISNYNNDTYILLGIQKQDADQAKKRAKKTNQSNLVNGLTQAERVDSYKLDHKNAVTGKLNFAYGYLPYGNQAHHIIPIEVFFDKKWTARHLAIVMASGYNINNPNNIIYLPIGKINNRFYHSLPAHSKGHGVYNDRVNEEVNKKIFSLVDEAVNEKECEKRKDLRRKIHEKLEEIQNDNNAWIIGLGPSALC